LPRLEYLRIDFGSISTYPLDLNATVTVALNSRVADNIGRVGVNYKFDRTGAIMAQY
jgi:hypothetical protein